MTIHFDGKPIEAREGDTIAAALYRSGLRIFTRSFKYHRPRGLLCVAGRCPNCLMNVDGVPNVRTCVEPVREGMQVRHQNAYPSLETDYLSIIDKLDRFLPVGFYYKTFLNKRYWHAAEPVIRRIAGLGELVPSSHLESSITHHPYDHQYMHTEIAVVGGGPAGMSAALEAARSGARVTLVDDQPQLGGRLRTDGQTYEQPDEYKGLRGIDIAHRLAEAVDADESITVLPEATVFGSYEGLLLGVIQGKRLIHLRAQRLIVATGAFEYPLVFHNNDLPGIMLGSGAQRLIHLHGIKPANRAVVVTSNAFGLEVACDLLHAGVEVGAVLLPSHNLPAESESVKRLREAGVNLMTGHLIQEAIGGKPRFPFRHRDRGKRVSGAVIVRVDGNGNPAAGTQSRVACDLICLSTGFASANGLLFQSGCKLEFDDSAGMFVPTEFAPNIFAAGDVVGRRELGAVIHEGRDIGSLAASSLTESNLKSQIPNPKPEISQRSEEPESSGENPKSKSCNFVPSTGHKKFVCHCLDVTEKDIEYAVAEGFDEMELLKRYAAVGMGPCQGKMCGMSNIAACARATGRTMAETGTTTQRQPIQPVALGALAGTGHHPVKLTPMHHKHLDLGARMMDMGEWKRPLFYCGLRTADCEPVEPPSEIRNPKSEIEREYRAVRERVGLIDVSTLGNLDVKGKDAGKLLDKVYTHLYSNLPVGRTRYGVICDDSGIMLDDGTVTRLAEDHYFITTTTGNIDFVEQWLGWWAVGTGMCVHISNVTAGIASVNLAGPRARDALKKLTDIDLSSPAFPYMASAQAQVAEVACLLLRIGFVGETGWEIHFPAEAGAHLWDELMRAGEEFGIAPFGVETQRLLRLEKKHVIVGVDTDALSNPLEADMAWVVRWEKPDFIGKQSLLRIRERGMRNKLVGFIMRDAVMPEDGCAVVSNGHAVGRVTSCRYSPHVGNAIGLAWAPVEQSADAATLQIVVGDRKAVAQVTSAPFYDPEGKRLRA